jgi:hypothetical protein
MAKHFEFKVGAFISFLGCMERKHKALNSKREDLLTLNLLVNTKVRLLLVCICGKDGKEDHYIAVYKNWIFADSNKGMHKFTYVAFCLISKL